MESGLVSKHIYTTLEILPIGAFQRKHKAKGQSVMLFFVEQVTSN